MNVKLPFDDLIASIHRCTICAHELELGPRPIIAVHPDCKILIIGQAPGSIVHRTGIPWNDKSGDNLRKWMGITESTFYDPSKIGIVPMGFCYPGKGKSGDLPPRKECAPQWHAPLIDHLKNVELILLIGNYAQGYYLKDSKHKTLTATVRDFRSFLPRYFVLPHPSPRNNIWQKKNEWFAHEVLPHLRILISSVLQMPDAIESDS